MHGNAFAGPSRTALPSGEGDTMVLLQGVRGVNVHPASEAVHGSLESTRGSEAACTKGRGDCGKHAEGHRREAKAAAQATQAHASVVGSRGFWSQNPTDYVAALQVLMKRHFHFQAGPSIAVMLIVVLIVFCFTLLLCANLGPFHLMISERSTKDLQREQSVPYSSSAFSERKQVVQHREPVGLYKAYPIASQTNVQSGLPRDSLPGPSVLGPPITSTKSVQSAFPRDSLPGLHPTVTASLPSQAPVLESLPGPRATGSFRSHSPPENYSFKGSMMGTESAAPRTPRSQATSTFGIPALCPRMPVLANEARFLIPKNAISMVTEGAALSILGMSGSNLFNATVRTVNGYRWLEMALSSESSGPCATIRLDRPDAPTGALICGQGGAYYGMLEMQPDGSCEVTRNDSTLIYIEADIDNLTLTLKAPLGQVLATVTCLDQIDITVGQGNDVVLLMCCILAVLIQSAPPDF